MYPVDLTEILASVQKPAQYLGNETNAIHKDFKNQDVRIVLVFPDAYEMGMSHMGLRILYDILNQIDGVVAERCFAPGKDLEKVLREKKLPLFSLESQTPLSEFDLIGISLPYELTYTNALNVIDLGGIPLWAEERKSFHPLILGGGTQSYNPEPMADFFDAIAIGDAEELIVELALKIREWKKTFHINDIIKNKNSESRQAILENFTEIEGLYVPSYFEPIYNADQTLQCMQPRKASYAGVKKRIVSDLNAQPYPTAPIVPNVKLIHDRIGIEIQRGCTRMCRFCQAGYIERPTRQRSPERVLDIAEKSLLATGLDEISLLSLSAGDYATLVPTLKELNRRYADDRVSISVPATRTETLTPEVIEQVKKVRMSGFTIAPEAGSERMRRVINKGNKVEDLLQACRNAFSAGYKLIKFYYMCGLPFENDEDIVGIANEARQALEVGKEYHRKIDINVSVSSFVPKPFTPFQWSSQMTIEETERKHRLIKSNLGHKALHFKHHDSRQSLLEGLFARGDRKLSKVILRAFEKGCRFDQWSEHFDFSLWQQSIEETKTDLYFYVYRERNRDEIFPWDHLFTQMQKDWLWNEFEAAQKEAFIADCSVDKCAQFCGACDFKEIKNKIFVIDDKPLAAKKGNREWYGRFGQNTAVPSLEKQTLKKSAENLPRIKMRVCYEKIGLAALTGHLELMTVLKRAILRTQTPVEYSDGYHPQMRLALGMPLPLGLESHEEYFDLILNSPINLVEFIERMNETLPQGLRVTNAKFVDFNSPSIYSLLKDLWYQVRLPAEDLQSVLAALEKNLEDFQKGKVFTICRNRERADKPSKSFRLNDCVRLPEPALKDGCFEFITRVDPDGTLKPTEVIQAFTEIPPSEQVRFKMRKIGAVYHSPI